MERVRIGVVGCGLIAQVMHLPYLAELTDRFEVTGLCDVSAAARSHARRWFPDALEYDDGNALLADRPEAVLVCTSGSHAEIVAAAAERGIDTLVEKPLCFGTGEGERMLAAARAHETILMVGYMKRFDPAYERFAQMLREDPAVQFVRVTTLESPPDGYVAHYPLCRPADVPEAVRARFDADDHAAVAEALGDHDEVVYRAYRFGLLDSLVHEFNLLRALLGEPDLVRSAHFWRDGSGIQTSLRFGDVECQLAWVLLDGVTRFEQELAFLSSRRRLTLSFPSPFLRSVPTRIVEVGGEPGTPYAWTREVVVGYDEAFRRELVEFHRAVIERASPRTGGVDALGDVRLCEAVARSFMTGAPVAIPRPKEAV